ncbi:MAG: hypothetical protein HY042_05205, partial [Spirochaetia bacterium]|nr:hypothetical protein [Spirochaetia bacterium]
ASIRTSSEGHARDTFFLQYNDKPLGAELAKDLELAVLRKRPRGS